MMAADVDLDNTDNCPQGLLCESCGRVAVNVSTANAPTLGVLCLSLCATCARAGLMPRLNLNTAAKLVREHAAHLGISLDEMAEIERRDRS